MSGIITGCGASAERRPPEGSPGDAAWIANAMMAKARGQSAQRYALLSRFLGRESVSESVATQVHFASSAETVWKRIVFYEEVPGHIPFLLRALLPWPLRSEGDKTAAGTTVVCTYNRGSLVKRIIRVEPRHLLRFEVIEQHLGIEDCVIARSGSYEIRSDAGGTQVILTTNYTAALRPRWVWRPCERLLAAQLHRHVLSGMRAAIFSAEETGPQSAPGAIPQTVLPEGEPCTLHHSRSLRS